jgi:hypothetical protein
MAATVVAIDKVAQKIGVVLLGGTTVMGLLGSKDLAALE